MIGFKFNPYEQRILTTLMVAFRPLTTRQVAEFSGISYNTVKGYLDDLKKRKRVKSQREGNRVYWSV